MFQDDGQAQMHNRERMPWSLSCKTFAASTPHTKTSYFVTFLWLSIPQWVKYFVLYNEDEENCRLPSHPLSKNEEATWRYSKYLFTVLGSHQHVVYSFVLALWCYSIAAKYLLSYKNNLLCVCRPNNLTVTIGYLCRCRRILVFRSILNRVWCCREVYITRCFDSAWLYHLKWQCYVLT